GVRQLHRDQEGRRPLGGPGEILEVGGQRGDGERRRRLHELVTERGRAVLERDLLDLQLELGRRVPRLSGRTRLIPIVRGARRGGGARARGAPGGVWAPPR